MEKVYAVRVNLISHIRTDANDARTDYVQSPLLPDLSLHQHLRVIHIHGLHYRDDAEGWSFQEVVIRTEDYLWKQIAIMIESAAAKLSGIFLYATDDNIIFHPDYQIFLVVHVMNDGPRPEERLGRLDRFNWSSLGVTLLACKKLVNVFILLNRHSPGGNRWIFYRKTTDAIQSQFPATLRRKLAFGVINGQDVIYMYVGYFVCCGFPSSFIYRSHTNNESSLPWTELRHRLIEAE